MLSLVVFGVSGVVSGVNFLSARQTADNVRLAREIGDESYGKIGMRFITGTIKTETPIVSGLGNFLTLEAKRYSIWKKIVVEGKSAQEVKTYDFEGREYSDADADIVSLQGNQRQNIKNLMPYLHKLYKRQQPSITKLNEDTTPMHNFNLEIGNFALHSQNAVKDGTKTEFYGVPYDVFVGTFVGDHNGQQFSNPSRVIIRRDMSIEGVRNELESNASGWRNMMYGSVVCGVVFGVLETGLSGGFFGLCK